MTKRRILDTSDEPTTLAIDVSAWQGDIDWHRVAQSEPTLDGKSQGPVKLVIVRAGDGDDLDKRAVRNLLGATDAGLDVAVYHYVRGCRAPEVQCAIIEDVLAISRVKPRFVALDLEGSPKAADPKGWGAWWTPLRPEPWRPLSTPHVLEVLNEMRDLLEAQEHRVVIYSGVSWHWSVAQAGHDKTIEEWADVPLWVPSYARTSGPRMPCGKKGEPAPWSRWSIWQYSAKGRVPGIDGPVDLNRVRG